MLLAVLELPAPGFHGLTGSTSVILIGKYTLKSIQLSMTSRGVQLCSQSEESIYQRKQNVSTSLSLVPRLSDHMPGVGGSAREQSHPLSSLEDKHA